MFNLFNNDLLFCSIFATTTIILGFMCYKIFLAYINKYYNIEVDSDFKTIFLKKKNTSVASNSETVDCRIEVSLPSEDVQEIREFFGDEITGEEADYILSTYIIPHLDSSTMSELILEIINHF